MDGGSNLECVKGDPRGRYLHTYIRTYIHALDTTRAEYITYIHTYIQTYIHTYIHTYIYIRACVRDGSSGTKRNPEVPTDDVSALIFANDGHPANQAAPISHRAEEKGEKKTTTKIVKKKSNQMKKKKKKKKVETDPNGPMASISDESSTRDPNTGNGGWFPFFFFISFFFLSFFFSSSFTLRSRKKKEKKKPSYR